MFCGVGGSSLGATMAGAKLVAGIDMWKLARDTYTDNFRGVKFFRRKLEYLSPREVKRKTGHIDLLLASPECTNHSCAKGACERSEESRKTAFQVTRFASVLKPRWVVVENVVHMKSWELYEKWLAKLRALGYKVRAQTLNAADFGVPQSRKRLFITCDHDRTPPEITPPAYAKPRTAREVVSGDGTYVYSILRAERRAPNTLARADRAIAKLGQDKPFLLVYYGSDAAGGWQSLDVPLRTITTLDRFAYVHRNGHGHEMRMLQIPELRRAMGFPDSYKLECGTRRERIKLLGNAVCPPVMQAVVQALMRAGQGEPYSRSKNSTRRRAAIYSARVPRRPPTSD